MFEVKPYKPIISGLHEIVANFISLLNDGNNDILYTGTNKFGNRVLGSIVFEDRQGKILRYFHLIITDDIYFKFLQKEKTLRSILEECEGFFAVDKDFNDEVLSVNIVSMEDIPEAYLPLINSYCPSFVYEPSLDYTFSLKGGLADAHKADPDVMNTMNSTFCKVLKSASQFVRDYGITPKIYAEPAMTGSFELNFKIELEQNQINFFTKPNDDIQNFFFKFFNYLFEKLPKEPVDIFKKDEVVSGNFKEIENDFVRINESRGIMIPDAGKEQKVIDLITYSLENLKDVEYNGFDRVELSNKNDDGINIPIALIEDDFYNKVHDKIYKPEQVDKLPIIQIDDNPQKYSIQVYSLNRETGNGSAYFVNADNGVSKILLHLRGRGNYENTIYTKNMDEDKPIIIDGIGKHVDGLLKELTVTFND